MKRLLTFNFAEDVYVIKENDVSLFSINGSDLQFDARKFYEGIYKGNNRSTNIEFRNDIISDSIKKGNYIFNWITAIFNAVQEEFNENDDDFFDCDELNSQSKVIILYDIAACAGNGFYVDGDVQGEEFEVDNKEADYAIKISGHSMEPQIADGSIALVKRCNELDNDDIGIFNIDGDAMCKKYTKNEDIIELVPINSNAEFKKITITADMKCIIQGKVIEVLN